MGANALRTNAEGSPLIREGQALELPDLAPASDDQLRALSREGGRITANNSAGLENARIEREAAANQSELARFANRSTAAVGSEASRAAGLDVQRKAIVLLQNQDTAGGTKALPLAAGARVYTMGIDSADARRYFPTAVNGETDSGGTLLARDAAGNLGASEAARATPHRAGHARSQRSHAGGGIPARAPCPAPLERSSDTWPG